MTKMIMWENVDQCYIMAEADEADFIKRFWADTKPTEDEFARHETEGPFEIERQMPIIQSVYEAYDC